MDKIDYLKNRKFSMENELTKLASDGNKNSAIFMRMQKLKSQINETNFQINNIEKNNKNPKPIINEQVNNQRDIFRTINNRNQ